MSSPSLPELMAAGIQHQRAGRLADAERTYRQVLQADPRHPQALYFLGLLAYQVGQLQQAATLIEQAVQVDPNQATFFVILGMVYSALSRLDRAEQCQRRAIEINPGIAEAHSNLASVLLAQKRLAEAEIAAKQALSINPNLGEAHLNLGIILKDQGKTEAAVSHLREAVKRGVSLHAALNNLGNALASLGRLDEARAALEQSVQASPQMPLAHWNLSLIYLMQGELKRGFAEHEWRLKHPASGAKQFPQPIWDGAPLNGRTILLHAEQGLGDAIQFARYAPLVAACGGRVVLECHPELTRLLATVPNVGQIVARGASLPSFDVHAPLLTLPHLFGTTLETIPATIPYVRAIPELVEEWRARMPAEAGARKVGLVWAGSPTHRNDRNRSMSLQTLAPLWDVPDVRFFSLQLGPAAAAVGSTELPLIDLTSHISDVADTAAMLTHLDLLISVDTAAVHIAGALGRPVWVLLPNVFPDWRWLVVGEQNAWYPTAKLFRQERAGEWEPVLQRVAKALADASPKSQPSRS